jgi:hypothetical protein
MAGFQVRAYPVPPGSGAPGTAGPPGLLLEHPVPQPTLPPRPGKDERPGEDPGPFGSLDFRVDQKSMSPPPPGAAGAGFFSGFSAITASVVRNRPAIEAAFCSADRVTFAGSMMPALNMST